MPFFGVALRISASLTSCRASTLLHLQATSPGYLVFWLFWGMALKVLCRCFWVTSLPRCLSPNEKKCGWNRKSDDRMKEVWDGFTMFTIRFQTLKPYSFCTFISPTANKNGHVTLCFHHFLDPGCSGYLLGSSPAGGEVRSEARRSEAALGKSTGEIRKTNKREPTQVDKSLIWHTWKILFLAQFLL